MSDLPRKYRIAIVGTGDVANAHAAAIGDLSSRAVITAAIDIDPSRAARFASQWDIPNTYPDLARLLERDDVDLVHICTPPQTHAPLAIQCLEAGVSVLLEKPTAMSLAEMDALIAAEQGSTALAICIFQHRFGSAAVKLRGLIARGALGRPLLASSQTLWYRNADYFSVPWRSSWELSGGGPTMGLGIHQFDLMISLLGSWNEVTAVAARQSRPTETEDVSVAIARFENGTIATVTNSAISPRQSSEVRIDFEDATVELEHLYGYSDGDWRFTAIDERPELDSLWNTGQQDVPSGHAAQFRFIFDALDEGIQPPASLESARETMEFAAAIYASAFTGGPVRRGDITTESPFYHRMDGNLAPWALDEIGAQL